MNPYDEQQVLSFQQDVQGEYVKAGQTLDLGNVVWAARMTYDAVTMGYPASRAKHLAELDAALGLVPPFPPLPSREQVCTATVGFQGLTATTADYGTFPMFGPETTTLSDADLQSYCAQIVAQGFSGAEISVSWQYEEPGFLMPVPGRDLSQDLPELIRRVGVMLRVPGIKGVSVFLAGDGRSAPKNPDGSYPYNDPVGWTYGHEWLMDNLPRIVAAFQTSPDGDLTQRVLFWPGYDGVFYGWGNEGEPDLQPQRVRDFVNLFRSVCPNGYLAIEHTPGHIPTGEGDSDWITNGPLDGIDVVGSEFNDPITPNPPGDQVWQIVARMVHPYTRPPNQPSGDDPNPPFYLHDSSRGPRFYWAYEYATYPWTRGFRTVAEVGQDRAYFTAMGVQYVC